MAAKKHKKIGRVNHHHTVGLTMNKVTKKQQNAKSVTDIVEAQMRSEINWSNPSY